MSIVLPPTPRPVEGFVAPGFERVADEFARNLNVRADVGAAFAAVADGSLVVDLWGGLADASTRRLWKEDTLQVIFSGTKGLVATCLAILAERGQLELEAPVAQYWPEFAANGKDRIRVSEIASHTSGIPRLTPDVALEDLLSDRHMAELVGRERPCWPGVQRIAYHSLTYGWLCGEVIRRITGVSVGQFFAAEVAQPLDLETWIGLPESEEARVSVLAPHPSFVPEPPVLNDCGARVYTNPPFLRSPLIWNRREFHRAEIPAAGGVSTARSLAKLYGGLARGGRFKERRLLQEETIEGVTRPLARGRDACTDDPRAFGVGFELQAGPPSLGPPADAFGHCGVGTSVHGAWPSLKAGFSYCMNELRDESQDVRARVLLSALHGVLS